MSDPTITDYYDVEGQPGRARRCYLAGPMSGLPGFNYKAFDDASDILVDEGWDVISPADLDRENLGLDFENMNGTEDLSDYRTEFARQDIDALLKVDAMILLPGWEKSTGVRNEMDIAAMLGVPIFSFFTGEVVPHEKHFSHAPVVEQPDREWQEVSVRRALLEGAADLVDGDRNVQYGDPSADFLRTANLWTAYLDGKTVLEPHDVAAMMVMLKFSRIRWSPEKEDSWMDAAGYVACGWHTMQPSPVAE